MSELPMGWVAIPLQEFGVWGSGGTPPKGNTAYYQGDIPWAVIGDLNDGLLKTTANHIADSGLANSSAKLLPPGTLLIAMYGSIGKLAIAGIECCTNQAIAFCRIDESVADTEYLFHLLRCVRPELIKLGQGASQQNISQTILKAFEVPLAPRAEQTRIAAKLDELLAQVDTLKVRIDGIPALLKRFRQSVLAAAVSGHLTEEWRSKNALPSPSSKKFEDLLRDKTKLSYGVLKPGDADEKGVPMVRVMNIGDWGRINNSEIFRISKKLSNEFKRTILEKGDILLSVMATIGRAAIVPDYLVGGNVNRALAVIKLSDDISSEFAFFQIMSPQFQAEFVEKQLGSAQRRINLSDLREFTVLLPVREEQIEIVRRVEQLFAFADQLEAKFASAKNRIDHLTQSILAKAFRGELVPQDPNDEPASVLLERIKAQRAAAPKAKRGKKASA